MSIHARRLPPLIAAVLTVAVGAAPASAADPSPSASPLPLPTTTPPVATSPPTPGHVGSGPASKTAGAQPTIRGLVWDDRNRNGIAEPGEPGIKGVGLLVEGPSFPEGAEGAKRRAAAIGALRALRPGQAAKFDPDIDVATTDATGRYVFENRRTGENSVLVYGITGEQTPAFWRLSPPREGDDRDADSDFDEAFNPYDDPPFYYGTAHASVTTGSDVRLDAGFYAVAAPKKDVTVGGTVWNDRNRNGLQDPNEPGIAGLPVNVANRPGPFGAKPARAASNSDAVTDADGRYQFKNLYPGHVLIYVGAGPEELKPVWTFTTKGVGDDRSRDSDVALSPHQTERYWGYSDEIAVQAGERVDVDAGLYRDEPSPSATPTPSSSLVPTPSPSAGGSGGSLPITGVAIGGFLAAGLGLVGGGIALTLAARRRRQIAA